MLRASRYDTVLRVTPYVTIRAPVLTILLSLPNYHMTTYWIMLGYTTSVEQFQELFHHLTTNLRNTQTPLLSKVDNKFQIACSEYYMSQGLTFKFDGDHEKLPLWIKKFKAL